MEIVDVKRGFVVHSALLHAPYFCSDALVPGNGSLKRRKIM
jgi:hypothetical protein